jgi:putative hemolysin
MNTEWLQLSVIVLLLLSCAFFASSQTSLFALDEMRLRKFKNRNTKKRLRILLKSPSLLLVTILLGSTLANVAAASLMEKKLELDNPLYTTLIVTGIILFFGEITPKTIAILRSEPVAAFDARLLLPFFQILKPLTGLINKMAESVLKLLTKLQKKDTSDFDKDQLSAIQSIVSREQIFDEDEKKLIESVLNFAGREVWNIMTPRTKTISVEKNTAIKETVKVFKKHKVSKMPVYDETDDNIAGVIYLRDIFQYVHNPEKGSEKKAGDFMEAMYFVPETKKLSEMLEDFRNKKIRIAAVVDEYGSSLGIVTIADVLGEIVGEIMDESFKLDKKIVRVTKDRFLVSGDISLDDFNTYFEANISSDEYETLAGYIIEKAGDIPDSGYCIEIENYNVIIQDRTEKQIEQFMIERK